MLIDNLDSIFCFCFKHICETELSKVSLDSWRWMYSDGRRRGTFKPNDEWTDVCLNHVINIFCCFWYVVEQVWQFVTEYACRIYFSQVDCVVCILEFIIQYIIWNVLIEQDWISISKNSSPVKQTKSDQTVWDWVYQTYGNQCCSWTFISHHLLRKHSY